MTAVARRPGTAYAFLAPAVVLFGVFLVVPMVGAVWLSLQDSAGFGQAEFVGLDNYVEISGDPVFWRAAANTLGLAVISVPLSLAIGLGLGLLLRERLPGRALWRALFFAPFVVSSVVVAMAGRWIFDENIGVANRLVQAVGLDAVSWQSSPLPAALSVLVMLVWARTGLVVIIYLAALQAVPDELVEAAQLDGAGRWARLRHVVLPQLRPTTFFLTVILVVETFHVFDLVYVMTGGGPGRATELVVTYAYREGFDAARQGYGSALGVVVFVVILAGTALRWRRQRALEADL